MDLKETPYNSPRKDDLEVLEIVLKTIKTQKGIITVIDAVSNSCEIFIGPDLKKDEMIDSINDIIESLNSVKNDIEFKKC